MRSDKVSKALRAARKADGGTAEGAIQQANQQLQTQPQRMPTSYNNPEGDAAAMQPETFRGYIPGSTGGRTDNKPIDVAEGSYVIPADILSGLGEGNSHAGAAALHAQFGMDVPHKADGGAIGAPVPIVAASGEMVVPPEKVAEIGGGDLQHGHNILDAMVKHVRKATIKKLKTLPGPKRN
jgi:hypothetical protein